MNPKGLLLVASLLWLSTAAGSKLPSVDGVYKFIQSNLRYAQDAPAREKSAFDTEYAGFSWLADAVNMSMSGPPAHGVHMVVSFFVRPALHHEFLEEWHRFAGSVKDHKGLIELSISKPIKDNVLFVTYAVFESKCSFHAVTRHEGFVEFFRFIMGRDIAVTHDLLQMVGGAGEKTVDKSATASASTNEGTEAASDEPCPATPADGDQDTVQDADDDTSNDDNVNKLHTDEGSEVPPTDGDHDPRHGPPRIMRLLTHFTVPPGAGKKFIKAWKKLECEVHRWKGSKAFSLFQVVGENTQYLGYAAFKPPKGGPPRKGREAFERYIEDIEDLGVSFSTTPIINLNHMPPRPHM